MFIKFLQIHIIVGSCFAFQINAMDMDDLRSRFLSTQPGGKVMQRDMRFTAQVEITNSEDSSEKSMKWSWPVSGPLPSGYDNMLTEPILTALRSCPLEIRSKLEERKRHVAFKIDIGGTVHGPVNGQVGFPMNDSTGSPCRGVTIIDKNDLPTDIFW